MAIRVLSFGAMIIWALLTVAHVAASFKFGWDITAHHRFLFILELFFYLAPLAVFWMLPLRSPIVRLTVNIVLFSVTLYVSKIFLYPPLDGLGAVHDLIRDRQALLVQFVPLCLMSLWSAGAARAAHPPGMPSLA